MTIRIGIISPSNIAYRRFLPALKKCNAFEYVGVAVASPEEWFGGDSSVLAAEREKAGVFQEDFGGKVFNGYQTLIDSPEVDAIYLPMPPALHYEWGKKVLNAGKHLLMEKPFTTNLAHTRELLALAEEKGLAVHENYMFLYHSQLAKIKGLIADGTLGDIRLYRMSFGFPKRSGNDFRYNKALGGGALLDCGGYPTRLALELMGETTQVVQASLTQPKGYEVDLFGNAVLQNADGQCAQISFGMDNAYQCQLEIWGSKNTLIAPRVFTAGLGVVPTITLRSSSNEMTMTLEEDDQFLHSIEIFAKSVQQGKTDFAKSILNQANLVEEIWRGHK